MMVRAEAKTVVERVLSEPWRGGTYVQSSDDRFADERTCSGTASLSSLTSIIEGLQETVQRDYVTIRTNETRTRNALIDPILRAMGWDNPSVVTQEYLVRYGFHRKGVADYALHSPGDRGRPFAFIEAKRMREDLTDEHRVQALNYASGKADSVKLVVVTNGDVWDFYQVLEGRHRQICSLSIRRDAADLCAKTLIRGFRMLSPEGDSPVQGNSLLPKLAVQDVSAAAPSPEVLPSAAAGMAFSVDTGKILTWFGVLFVAGMMAGYVVGFSSAGPWRNFRVDRNSRGHADNGRGCGVGALCDRGCPAWHPGRHAAGEIPPACIWGRAHVAWVVGGGYRRRRIRRRRAGPFPWNRHGAARDGPLRSSGQDRRLRFDFCGRPPGGHGAGQAERQRQEAQKVGPVRKLILD